MFKVAALVSGGKDSLYSAMKCHDHGHQVVVLANLHPSHEESQRDSYMYQTQGWEMLPAIAECMGLPLERRAIVGTSANQDLLYHKREEDEVEDMYELLREITIKHPEVNAVCSGAVLSTYQRSRVEDVCERLGLVSLAYLWQRDQTELLEEMIDRGVEAVLVKVCSIGLGSGDLGRTIAQSRDKFVQLGDRFGMHVCGEGGEYETLTLDCPLFTKGRIIVDRAECVVLKPIPDSPICVWRIHEYRIESKLAVTSPTLPPMSSSSSLAAPPAMALLVPAPTTADVSPARSQSPCVVGPVCGQDIVQCMSQFACELSPERIHQVCIVHLYLQNLDDFPKVNLEFAKLFGTGKRRQPPARVTLELATKFKLSVVAVLSCQAPPQILQVRSRSEWAPMCIGPYSQASTLGPLVLVSGQIPLVSETMQMLPPRSLPDVQPELELCFQHCFRVARQLRGEVPLAALVYCSTERQSSSGEQVIARCAQSLRSVSRLPPLLVLLAVPRLPREARVEVEFTAMQSGGCSQVTVDEPGRGQAVWSRMFCTAAVPGCESMTVPVQAVGVLVVGSVEYRRGVQVSVYHLETAGEEE
ncbi:hypothetical protein BASA81_006558 [Batrachochytrium salamandrivorans]|nr:hypothetical protein BASA81_006558 [Batrachochytrium salamandrivorans]